MKVDSLKDLKSAFARWRRQKQHVREAVPEELVERARRAVPVHGLTAVVTVTRVERGRLTHGILRGKVRRTGSGGETSESKVVSKSPTFSRLELGARTESDARPLAELVIGSDVRLRIYEATPEMLGLLSVACAMRGAR